MSSSEQAETRVVRGFWIHLAAYVCVVTGLTVLNLIRRPDKLWVVWVAGGWGIGMAAHAAAFFSPQGRKRMIRRMQDRMAWRETERDHPPDETHMTERMSQSRSSNADQS